MYVALLIAVNKIKQEKENQVQVENVQSRIDNEFCNPATDHISGSVKENSISVQIIQNMESSTDSSGIDNIRGISDQPELLLIQLQLQILKTYKLLKPGTFVLLIQTSTKWNRIW